MLADLHDADVDAIGLGDLARREGYIERQIKRWSHPVGQLQDPRTARRSTRSHGPSASNVPEQQGVSIAHGDYRFGNCLTDVHARSHRRRARLGAVHARRPARRPRLPRRLLGAADGEPVSNDPSAAEGFPTYAEVVERYADRTGRDVSRIDYYVAFSSWRLAVISEGVYARYLHGAMGDQASMPRCSTRSAPEPKTWPRKALDDDEETAMTDGTRRLATARRSAAAD